MDSNVRVDSAVENTTLERPFFNVLDVIDGHGRSQGHKLAVLCGDVSRNWAELTANINRVAHALAALGIGKGDKVAVLMGQRVETIEVIFGIARAGACAVPLASILTGQQLADLISDSDSIAIFATSDYAEKLLPSIAQLKKVNEAFCFSVGFEAENWHHYETLVDSKPTSSPNLTHESEDDFMIIYSSGTTGLPKGILTSHRARSHVAISHCIELGIGSASRVLTTTPLSSNGTWTVMLSGMFAGASVYVLPQFDVGQLLQSVNQNQITHTFMVPTQIAMMMDDPAVTGPALSSLQSILVGGSVLRQDLRKRFTERVGNLLTELYGCTEGFATMLSPDRAIDKSGSVGRAVIGYEGKIVADDDAEAAPGERGEIAGYGAGMLTSYYGRTDATAELVWTDGRGRKFIRTGDIGVMDEEGFITIVDRRKDMIISGGYNVFPVDIEQVVAQHPEVRDVAIIGAPHDKWGETPVAVIIPKSGVSFDAEEFLAWSNARLGKHQRLTSTIVVDDFPRNALGKVLKRVLRTDLGFV